MNLIKEILKHIFSEEKRFYIKNLFLYKYVFLRKFINPDIQYICFFYLPEVPDFGKDFLYFKLGKKEKVYNPKNYNILFEADLSDNISVHNIIFMDYSGLYALYKNNIIKKKYIFLIHYDTQILHKKWKEIIEAQVVKKNIVYSTWEINKENSEISKWVYTHIDDIFLLIYNKSYLSFLVENKFSLIPNSSQFACSRETFIKLMDFLLPIYKYLLTQTNKTYLYAHLLERAWGLFFALEGFKKEPVIKDSHSQTGKSEVKVIQFELLSQAIKLKVKKFSELLN